MLKLYRVRDKETGKWFVGYDPYWSMSQFLKRFRWTTKRGRLYSDMRYLVLSWRYIRGSCAPRTFPDSWEVVENDDNVIDTLNNILEIYDNGTQRSERLQNSNPNPIS